MGYSYEMIKATMPEKSEVIASTPNPASKQLIENISRDGSSTFLDRFAGQQPQCGFGLKGTCCRMCLWGPCRISEKNPRGICGKTQDEVVMGNHIRSLVAGLAAHARHGHEIYFTIKAVADGKLSLRLAGEKRIIELARRLGIAEDGKKITELAGRIADILIEDLGRMDNRVIRLLDAFAPAERKAVWKNLGILPRSAAYEIMESLHMTTLGGCSDWKAILRQEQRSALAYCYSTLLGSSLATEMLYGVPEPKIGQANYGVLKKDHINLLLHGHSPVMAEMVLAKVNSPKVQSWVRRSGAKGIVMAGLCCTGTELLSRHGVPSVTNILGQELVIGTGAVDCLAVDMQCVIPGIKPLADRYGTKIVTTCNSNRIPGAEHLPFDPESPDTLEADAERIVKIAIEAYQTRNHSNTMIPDRISPVVSGWNYETIIASFQGMENILKLLKEGTLRGIATVVGCNTPKVAYEFNHVSIVRRLIASDILVLTTGCSSHALLNEGFCGSVGKDCGPGLSRLGRDYGLPPVLAVGGCVDNARTLRLFITLAELAGRAMKDLPLVFVGPEPGNEKTLGQGLSFLLHGISNVIGFPGPIPPADGKTINEIAAYFGGSGALEELGAKIYTRPNPDQAAGTVLEIIAEKRKQLLWN
jgi:anaerobic carbon-monoxide dehydrogenase catalytic subunit